MRASPISHDPPLLLKSPHTGDDKSGPANEDGRHTHSGKRPPGISGLGAFKTLSELTRRLRQALRQKGRSTEEAEDLVQDALLRYEIFRRAQPVRNPEAFIARTALNLAIDGARRRRRSPIAAAVLDFCEAGDQAPGPYDILASRHSLERLKAGLEVMPTKTRTILLAQRLDGMTYSQIAEQQGLSQSAVEKHIARAMLFLQQWMQDW